MTEKIQAEPYGVDSLFGSQLKEMIVSLDDGNERREMLNTACSSDCIEYIRKRKSDDEIVGIFCARYKQCSMEPDRMYLKRLVASKREILSNQRNGQSAFDLLGFTTSPKFYLNQRIDAVRHWGDSACFEFGIPPLDHATGGVLPGEILVLDGAQGSMKTSLLLKGIETSLVKGTRILFYSLDMSPAEIMERRLQRWLNCDQYTVQGMMRANDKRIEKAVEEIDESDNDNFYMRGNERGELWNIDSLLTFSKQIMPDVIAIDYLTLLQKDRQDEIWCVREAMPKLKRFAQEYGVAVIVLSQMGRGSKREQYKGIIGGHSKGGGIVEELAYTEIELFKDNPWADGEPAKIIATVTKTRRGPSGKSFALDYSPTCLSFTGEAVRVARTSTKAIKPVFNPKDSYGGYNQ